MRFGLAGNPNCGKTTLFNALTGSNARVGNWAGVTVERKEGSLLFTKEECILIDLPGIYSLSPYSPEERIARNFLLEETPDLIINILDAVHLERSLYLTTQLLELDCPVVVALNMADLLEKRGEVLDCGALSALLGVEVVLISAARKEGLSALVKASEEAAKKPRRGRSILADGVMRQAFIQAEGQLCGTPVVHKTFHAVKALEDDPVFMKSPATRGKAETFSVIRQRFLSETGYQDAEAAAADLRYRFITERVVPAVRRKTGQGQDGFSERMDRLLTHKYWGIPIFFLMMFLVFHLTFGASLFGTGIPAPGVFFKKGMEIWAGLASREAGRFLSWLGASPWAFGLVQDAMIGGVFAVLSFLPQILCLFLFLSIMEDSGYMARAAFLMDRVFRGFGLTGKAFLPLLMGFGCSVPAMLSARTLETEKDRRMTILLVPFMSCGAKLPIYALFGAALFGQSSEFAIFGIYLIGLLTAVSAAFVLSRTVFRKEEAPFIMELPAYHMPRAGTLFALLWEKLSDYVVRAGTLILAASIVIWFCSSFDFSLHMVEVNARESILGGIGRFLAPFFAPLGFAEGPEGWKAVVSVLSGLVAKEAVVSTLGVLYGGGENVLPAICQAFTPLSALSFMAFNLLSVPCMAAVSTMHTEMRSFKWTIAALLFWVGTAFCICTAIYQAGCFLGLS